jgi:hypothetical protein
MNTKISDLPAATALDGTESLPAVQGGANVKTTPLDVVNFATNVPDGMNAFRVLPFDECTFDPFDNETVALMTSSPYATGIQFFVSDGEGDYIVGGWVSGRLVTGMVLGVNDPSKTISFENCNGLTVNHVHIINADGNLIDNAGNVVLNRAIGPQAAIPNATGAGDVVARLNDLLAALRALQLIRT